jgi:hypothetical protein
MLALLDFWFGALSCRPDQKMLRILISGHFGREAIAGGESDG